MVEDTSFEVSERVVAFSASGTISTMLVSTLRQAPPGTVLRTAWDLIEFFEEKNRLHGAHPAPQPASTLCLNALPSSGAPWLSL